jgi:cytidyltransferase-like protein
MRLDTSTVVLAHGCFDVFHYGHLLHLRAAALMGDHLVVAVTMNEHVNKGEDRPLFDETQRLAIINELRCVDEVLLARDSLDALVKVKPDVFVKGREYDGKIQAKDAEYCAKHGITIAFTDEETYSSSDIINGRSGSR